MFEDDALPAIDARIALLRRVRGSAERFSDAFWRADDALAWLRMVRDDAVRTGHLRNDLLALLEALPVGVVIAVEVVAPEMVPMATANALVVAATAPALIAVALVAA